MKFPHLASLLGLVGFLVLAGCNLPVGSGDGQVTANAPAAYETVAAILTETARVSPATLTPGGTRPPATDTPQLQTSPEQLPTASPVIVPTQTATLVCNLARAGSPIDVTIPDDTHMQPGESFEKIWRLVNAGGCTWTEDYAVTWFSGDDLGVRQEETFHSSVAPGSSIDIAVDMIAPERPGLYQSNWKLRDETGNLFGIGPGGGAPFWVRIEVVAVDTPTLTVLPPTLTPTAAISITGDVMLNAGQGLDVDAGSVTTGSAVDFTLENVDGQYTLSPQNGARTTLYGAGQASLDECQTSSGSEEAIQLGIELEGSSLCIQTSRGLPGSLLITRFDEGEGTLGLTFTVWSVP